MALIIKMSLRDKSLVIAEHTGSSKVYPQEVFYQEVRASGSTDSSTNFNVKTPGSGWLLSNEIWLQYKMRLVGNAANDVRAQLFEAPAAGNAPALARGNIKYLPRANNPLSRCMSNINVQINSASITDRPADVQDVMDRLWLSESESESCSSTSAGYFDGPHEHYPVLESSVPEPVINFMTTNVANTSNLTDGTSSTHGVVAVAAPGGYVRVVKYKGSAPFNKPGAVAAGSQGTSSFCTGEWEINEGAQKRWGKFVIRGFRSTAANAGAGTDFTNAAGDSFDVVFYERLPSSMFFQYKSRDKLGLIPHIQSMNILIQYLGELQNKWGQASIGVQPAANAAALSNAGAMAAADPVSLGTIGGAAANTQISSLNLTTDSTTNEVYLHLKWCLPPVSMQIPSSVRVKAPAVLVHTKEIGTTLQRGNPNNVSDPTMDVEFPWVPTMILIYAKVPVNYLGVQDPTEMFAEIASLDITTDGETGKLMSMKQEQIYSAWLRNGNKMDDKRFPFEQWRSQFCCAALSPGDYGARKTPGSLGRFLLSVRPTLTYHHPFSKSYITHPVLFGNTTAKLEAYAPANKKYDLYIVGVNDSSYMEVAPGGFARIGFKAADVGGTVTGGSGGFGIGIPGLSGHIIGAEW